MIRRSVRSRFRNVYWNPPVFLPDVPIIFVPNHHGWFDGYLMFLAVSKLKRPTLDWIAEYDSFQLFGKVGGLPFPADNAAIRGQTIKKSIRLMQKDGWNLLVFAEGILHQPPDVWEFGKALDLVLKSVPGAAVVPVAIHYKMSMHERPEAFLRFGEPMLGVKSGSLVREQVVIELEGLVNDVRTLRDRRPTGLHSTGTSGAGFSRELSGADAPPPHPSSLRSQTLSPSGEGSSTPGAQVPGLHLTGLTEAGPGQASGADAPPPSLQFANAYRPSPIEGEVISVTSGAEVSCERGKLPKLAFEILHHGTKDVNERFKLPSRGSK